MPHLSHSFERTRQLSYYVSLWVASRLGIDRKFSHMLSTAVSICGVSAAIATFGAIKGEKNHLNMTLLLVAVFVIPMFLGMCRFWLMPSV